MSQSQASQQRDEQIKDAVLEHLKGAGLEEVEHVRVRVHDGVVELSGQVPSVMAHQAATDVAQRVVGVREVANRLAVVYQSARPSPTDEELQGAAQSALRTEGQINPARISVQAHDGVVALDGTVESYWQRTIAEQTVATVEGVTLVVNDLAVVPGAHVEDERIAHQIVSELEHSAYVDADDVTVKVDRGRVTLSGTLPHWQALRAAYEAAVHTPGVRVIVNHLKVAP